MVKVEDIKEQKHIANLKLATSKQAIKIHVFENERFYVIPIKELDNRAGKVFEYIENKPEVVGFINKPVAHGKKVLRACQINNRMFYLQDNYIELLKGGADLTLAVYEE